MKGKCKEFMEMIVEAAEGRRSEESISHLQSCGDCRTLLGDMKAIFNAGKVEMFSAPESIKASARAIMQPKTIRPLVLRFALLGAGARSAENGFQYIFDAEGEEVRVVYQPKNDGWEIVGRAPVTDATLYHGSAETEVSEDGYFTFFSSELADSAFEIVKGSIKYSFPAVEAPNDEHRSP